MDAIRRCILVNEGDIPQWEMSCTRQSSVMGHVLDEPFKKSIDVFSNDPVNGRIVLYIQGKVEGNAKEAEVKNTSDQKKDAVTIK
jgi:hypothetical protein